MNCEYAPHSVELLGTDQIIICADAVVDAIIANVCVESRNHVRIFDHSGYQDVSQTRILATFWQASTAIHTLRSSMHRCQAIRDHLLVNRNIKYLHINGCELGPEGAACIARALQNNRCILKRLKLQDCRIGSDGFRDAFEVLQTNTTLKELNVNDNRDGAENDFATTVFESLTNNTTLKLLDISLKRRP